MLKIINYYLIDYIEENWKKDSKIKEMSTIKMINVYINFHNRSIWFFIYRNSYIYFNECCNELIFQDVNISNYIISIKYYY